MFRTLCAAALLLAGCSAPASTYDEARNAYGQNRVAEAEQAFRKIAADPAVDPKQRAASHRELARIAWLIDGNADAALAAVRSAEAAGEGLCDAAQLRARILHEAGRSGELVAAAGDLEKPCSDPPEAAQVRLAALAAALDLAAKDPGRRAQALAAASGFHGRLPEETRTGLGGAAASLRLALQQSDAAAALKAWKDYFWLADADVPQGMRKAYPAAAPVFEAALAPQAAAAARLPLVDLLVRAGFAQAAEEFARSAGLSREAAAHPLWRKAAAYFEARRTLEAELLASNRRVARGGDATDLKAALDRAADKLMRAAGLSGDPMDALRQAYGIAGQTGNTDGHASVHLGHIVEDERRTIEQYGHRADVGFLALDNMIANGFNSWLWDGTAAVGGWASPGPVIVQVRPEYTGSPLRAWSIFSGGAERRKLQARQAERAAADAAALADADVAYLPGLQERLWIQVADQVGARARAAAAGGDLRRAFLQEYWRATFQQSILTHEGRHALDRTLVTGLARLSDSNLEYRAKLSELALAEYPRLAIVNINDATIGSGSGHGDANEKLLQAYVDWMRANGGSIRGWNPAAPPLTQLDKLSDDQIRAVARSLDPIAK